MGHDKEPNIADLLRRWGLKAERWKKISGVYQVRTGNGLICLKPTDRSVHQITFAAGLVQHCIGAGFDQVSRILYTLDGAAAVRCGEQTFYVNEWRSGREMDLRKTNELTESAKTMARFHLASVGFQPPANSQYRNHYGHWIGRMTRRIEGLHEFAQIVRGRTHLTTVDRMWIHSADALIHKAEEALFELEHSNYRLLSADAARHGVICHHDVAGRNLILGDGGIVYLIDFDPCTREEWATDIHQILRRVLKKWQYRFRGANLLLDAYSEIRPLSHDELHVVYALLLFPQKIWRVLDRYYGDKKNRPESFFVSKLEDPLRQENQRVRCVQEYATHYLHC